MMQQIKNPIGQMKVSEALPLIRLAGQYYNLPMSFERSWTIAKRFINNSIKNN